MTGESSHCEHVFSHTLSDTEEDIGPCPKCGATLNFDDLEELDEPNQDLFFYLVPALRCHDCGEVIELPYSPLPQTDEDGRVLLRGEDPPELPSAEWSAVFGCRTCGLVSEYDGDEVSIERTHRWTEGSHQSGTGVYYAKFPCGNRDCKSPVSMYIDTANKTASEALVLLRGGRFDGKKMPCGHEMKTIPAAFYSVEPVHRRLW